MAATECALINLVIKRDDTADYWLLDAPEPIKTAAVAVAAACLGHAWFAGTTTAEIDMNRNYWLSRACCRA